jgi:hypothetical protein
MGMAAAWLLHGHGCMGMAAAWACCCFKTGMHGAWHAVALNPGCIVHGMSLQQQQLLRACMRACVAAFVIDTIYELTRRRRPRRGGGPELALLTAPNFREYFYTEIRFSTPALSALLPLAGQICLS